MNFNDSSESSSITTTKSNNAQRQKKILKIGVLGDKETGKQNFVQSFVSLEEKNKSDEEMFEKITG